MSEKKEMSQLARQILSGGGHVTLFTQQEFDEALALGKAEIMQVAVQTTKQAIMIERQACAEVCKRLAEQESDGEVSTVLVNAAMAIQTRMLGQL